MELETGLLRARDVAYILDCSPDDVYVLIRKGVLPAIKKGRFYRFRLDEVMAYKRDLGARERVFSIK